MHELKSPSKIKLSHVDDSESILSENESRYDSMLLGLQHLHKNLHKNNLT